jgi:predicted RND superfamily exporter protein
MTALFEALRPFLRTVVRRAGWVLAIALLLTAAGLQQATQLTINPDIASLLPDDYPSVQALERLQETVGGESEVAVGITSPSFEANKQFAEALIPQALDLTQRTRDQSYLTRVEYRRDTEFLKDNALYLASNSELRSVEQFLENQIAEAKQEANPFFVDIEEDEEGADEEAQELEGMYSRLVGSEYPISDDSTTMVLKFFPAGSRTDVGFIDNLYEDLGALVDRLEPGTYHPEMEVVLAGRLLRQEAEVQAITQDVLDSFAAGVATVILVVVLYFLYKSYRTRTGGRWNGRVLAAELTRAPVLALVIALPLFMSLAWTGGVAHLLFGELTIMTSTLGLVLFGLGIDFGIHFYARYTEARAEGASVGAAAEHTFATTGQAIATGALTTAGALYVLSFAQFKGFSEFGVISGTGVLFALVAMTVVMPALLALLERAGLLDLTARAPATNGQAAGRFGGARPIVVGGLVAVVAAIAFAPSVSFEYDFGSLEPDYTAYEERAAVIDRVNRGGDGDRRNPAYVLVDSAKNVPDVVRAVREKMQDSTSTVLAVESLQERFPLADTAQQGKLQRIADIRETLNENKYLRNQDDEGLERLRRAAQTETPIELAQVPEFLRKQFTTKEGELGTFVMIYPSVGLSDGRKSIAFSNEIGTITTENGNTYHAASTPLVAADMLKLVRAEAPWMVAATFVIVALLMLLNFRSVRWAALALVPLVVGVLWMLLIMEVFGLKLNFYNMVVLPAILGIGNDAGVHMVHRYREEGKRSLWTVLRSTGEHVTMGTLTTAIGFSGLLLSFHPGLNSMGTLAVVGLGTTLAAAIVFLPGLLQWMEDANAAPDDLGTPPGATEPASSAEGQAV